MSQSALSLILIASILGICVGSFLNVVIHRLPIMIATELNESSDGEKPFNLAQPCSHCPNCGRSVRWNENIPLLSYLWLKGRCAGCGNKILLRYPLVEAVTGILSTLAAWQFGATLTTVYALLFIWLLIALAGIDYDTMLLPDNLTQPLLWLGLVANLNGSFVRLDQAVIGAVAGYLILWSIYWVFRYLTGREGMGYGDFKLLAALGAWFGWLAIPWLLLAAALVGIIVHALVLGKSRVATPMPFGPALAAAGLASLFLEKSINLQNTFAFM